MILFFGFPVGRIFRNNESIFHPIRVIFLFMWYGLLDLPQKLSFHKWCALLFPFHTIFLLTPRISGFFPVFTLRNCQEFENLKNKKCPLILHQGDGNAIQISLERKIFFTGEKRVSSSKILKNSVMKR